MRRLCLILLGLGFPAACWAQQGPVMEAAVLSDHRVRGLSWSDGKVAPQVYARLPLGDFSLSGQATLARNSDRHGGGDAALELSASYGGEAGLLRWYGGVTGHMFPGGGGSQDFAEIDAGLAGIIGPLELGLSASWAPSQRSIGGSNLDLRADAQFALVGTPVSLVADIGHSSGTVREPRRAARLRPGGSYVHWSIGGRYIVRSLSFSLTYSDTDISADDIEPTITARHYGARLIAGIHLAL